MNRLYELKEEYSQSFNNRENLGNKISNLASHLMIFANSIKSQISSDINSYKTSDELFIKKPEKIISILFDAQNSPDFALKKIYASGIASFEVSHGTRETEKIGGTVYIIGDSTILSKLEDEKVYFENDIKMFANKILESKKSLIMTSNHYFYMNLLPQTVLNSYLEIKGNDSIYCYLQNDVMKEVVDKLLSYAKENGNHINDIPEDEILNNISVTPKKLNKVIKRDNYMQ